MFNQLFTLELQIFTWLPPPLLVFSKKLYVTATNRPSALYMI